MVARRLTSADVCKVTDYNRDQLRAVLKELPGWSDAPGARMAREFVAHDLIVLSVVHTLDAIIDIRRRTIAAILPMLKKALSGPKPIAQGARLAITFAPPSVDYLDGKESAPEGVVIALQPILERVDRYLGTAQIPSRQAQADLFSPALVRSRRRRVQT